MIEDPKHQFIMQSSVLHKISKSEIGSIFGFFHRKKKNETAKETGGFYWGRKTIVSAFQCEYRRVKKRKTKK